MPDVIKWPKGRALQDKSNDFSDMCGVQGVVGAIDGCHIEILAPHDNPMAYYNRKKFYSLVLLAVCDANMQYTYTWAGNPGSSHDAAVLRLSSLFNSAEGMVPPGFIILGDSAFPLLRWLVTPYRNFGNLTQVQRMFNRCHSKTRQVIERSFGLLKSRFRRLTKLHISDLTLAVNSILSGCVLHNICQQNDEELFEVEGINRQVPQPPGPHGYEMQGVRIRQRIAEQLRQLHR